MKTMKEFEQILKEDDIRLSNEINKLMQIRRRIGKEFQEFKI